MFINLLLITICICFIVDLSGFVETVKKWIWRLLKGKDKPYKDFNFKPFDCSLCMSHHCMFIWALCTGNLSLPIYAVICGLSFLSSNITGFMSLIKDLLIKAENKIEDILL